VGTLADVAADPLVADRLVEGTEPRAGLRLAPPPPPGREGAARRLRPPARPPHCRPSGWPSCVGGRSSERFERPIRRGLPVNDIFYLTEEQRMIRDLARKVARDRIAPHAAHYDETESYPTESMRALVESGLFGIWVPEEYGGTAMGCLALSLVAEELGWACAGTT